MLGKMKYAIPIIALLAVFMFIAPPQANARVHFRVYVGPTYPAYPYAYGSPYVYSNPYPYSSYPYGYGYVYPYGYTYSPSYYGDRHWRHERHEWREHERHEHGSRGYYGYRR